MKRLVAAAVMLVFVLTAYLSGYFYIHRTYNQANRLLDECIAVYKNDSDAKENALKLQLFWDEREKLLSVFSNHSHIDQIELAISSLAVYSDSPDNEIFYEYSETVKTLLHQLMEDTLPSAHSIL